MSIMDDWNLNEAHGLWPTGKQNPIQLSSCDFRDGQQSLIATRMRTEDMVPILREMDSFGFACIEM